MRRWPHIRRLERTHNMPENRVFYLALPRTRARRVERLDGRTAQVTDGSASCSRNRLYTTFTQPGSTTLHRYIEESQIRIVLPR
jgi:hypothetical protein